MLDPHGALICTMVIVSAADSNMTDAELAIIGEIVGHLPVFRDFDRNTLPSVLESCSQLLSREDGLEEAFTEIKKVLPAKSARNRLCAGLRRRGRRWRGAAGGIARARIDAPSPQHRPADRRRHRARRPRPLPDAVTRRSQPRGSGKSGSVSGLPIRVRAPQTCSERGRQADRLDNTDEIPPRVALRSRHGTRSDGAAAARLDDRGLRGRRCARRVRGAADRPFSRSCHDPPARRADAELRAGARRAGERHRPRRYRQGCRGRSRRNAWRADRRRAGLGGAGNAASASAPAKGSAR